MKDTKQNMKYIVILCDGMSDLPCAELGGGTPMSVAAKPNMNRLAAVSEVGMVQTVPAGLAPGSDVANLSVLGYDPERYYTGRSPLEAESMDLHMDENDIAIRTNLVTLSDCDNFLDATMVSYCGDDIGNDAAREIINLMQGELGSDTLRFHFGMSYRHCTIQKGGCRKERALPVLRSESDRGEGERIQVGLDLTPPHDIIGKRIGDYLDPDSEFTAIMERSYKLLKGKQANCVWFWGEGKKATLPSFYEKYGKRGAIISAVDLLKGIGKLAGMDVLHVEGATGYIDTNFAGKAQAAIGALRGDCDFVFLHLEAPDECGHRGEVANKVKSLELIDDLILAPILREFGGEPVRIMILPDHPTPLSLMTHTSDPVPYLIYDSTLVKESKVVNFCEAAAESTGVFVPVGHELMGEFLQVC